MRRVLLQPSFTCVMPCTCRSRGCGGKHAWFSPRALLLQPLSLFCIVLLQVRIEGVVEKVPDEESDAYFYSRPRCASAHVVPSSSG